MRVIQRLRYGPNTQRHSRLCWEPQLSSEDDKAKRQQLDLKIKDREETTVSDGHVNTRFFIISDTHTKVFSEAEIPTAAAAADVMICCGDLTKNSELDEYKKVIKMLGQVRAPLKLVVAGNHDGTLDVKGWWNAKTRRYKRWPRRTSERASELFGSKGEARKLLKQGGFQFLKEGHHKFPLENGAELKVYASPATPMRKSRYRAFQYRERKGGHVFRIDQDVDVVITHGPPRGIRDPDPRGVKYKGCSNLFDSVARARPRLHCFGHNHGGWGATFVEWNDGTGGDLPAGKESTIHYETELMSLNDIDPSLWKWYLEDKEAGDRRQRQLAKTRCVPTSHCAGDENFILKGKHTLFINASRSKVDRHDNGRYTQWPWLVDVELPSQRAGFDSAIDVDTQSSEATQDNIEGSTEYTSSGSASPEVKTEQGLYNFQNQVRRMGVIARRQSELIWRQSESDSESEYQASDTDSMYDA